MLWETEPVDIDRYRYHFPCLLIQVNMVQLVTLLSSREQKAGHPLLLTDGNIVHNTATNNYMGLKGIDCLGSSWFVCDGHTSIPVNQIVFFGGDHFSGGNVLLEMLLQIMVFSILSGDFCFDGF